MRKSFKSIIAAALLVGFACGTAFAADFARIGTSSIGGGFYLIGNTIAQVCNSVKNDVNYTAITGGSTKNINGLAKGDMEFGMCQSPTIDESQKGIGAFKKPMTSIRFVTSIYPMPMHVLVNSKDINSVYDFRGKNIDFGAIGAGIETYTRIALAAYGMTDKDVKVDRFGKSESAEAIKTGEVQGNFWTTTAPNAQVTDMIAGGVRLISLDPDKCTQIIKDYPYFSRATIPGGTYDGYPEPIETIASIGILLSDEKVSEDIVYKTVKAMYENEATLKERLPAYFGTFSKEHALDGCSIEIHPGALKYYKEIGVIK